MHDNGACRPQGQLNLNFSKPGSHTSRIKRKHRGKRKKSFKSAVTKWLKKVRRGLRPVKVLANILLASLFIILIVGLAVKMILIAGHRFGLAFHIPHAIRLGIEILEKIFSEK
jgi:hypothetical protein